MRWLISFISHRETTSNHSPASAVVTVDEELKDIEDGSSDGETVNSQQSQVSPSPTPKLPKKRRPTTSTKANKEVDEVSFEEETQHVWLKHSIKDQFW